MNSKKNERKRTLEETRQEINLKRQKEDESNTQIVINENDNCPKFKIINGKVHIGNGLYVEEEDWRLIKRMDTFSKMSAGIAMALFPNDLNIYTFNLKKSQPVKGLARKLFPQEVLEVIKGVIKHFTQRRKMKHEEMLKTIKQVKTAISKKIRKLNEKK